MFRSARRRARQRQQIDLETFLKDLSEEEAANARAAAARIDELEHAAQRIGMSDRSYIKLFVAACICTLVAIILSFTVSEMFHGGTIGLLDVIILLLASAFPALVFFYSFKMNERTKLDRQKFDIIETYFLPHDAIYLPPGPDRARGVVAISTESGGWERAPEPKEKVRKPGWYW